MTKSAINRINYILKPLNIQKVQKKSPARKQDFACGGIKKLSYFTSNIFLEKRPNSDSIV